LKRIRSLISAVIAASSSALIASPVLCQQKSADQSGVIFATEIETAEKLIDLLIEFCVKYSFQVLSGLVVLFAGVFVAKFVANISAKFFKKHRLDVTVSKFLVAIIKLTIVGFSVLVALGKFGITIAPFIAGLSVVGFGTSFALQAPFPITRPVRR